MAAGYAECQTSRGRKESALHGKYIETIAPPSPPSFTRFLHFVSFDSDYRLLRSFVCYDASLT
jgi:hypothetical protein